MRKDIACILLAGGSGSRMSGDQAKQFVRIAGKTILEHSLNALRQHMPQVRIVVTAPFADVDKVAHIFRHDPLVQVVAGGVSRQASTLKGLKALADDAPHNILIHDGARPFLDGRTLSDVIEALEEYEAVDVAIPTADTIIAERDGFIESIPKRKHLLRGQTPQAFRYKDLVSCYRTLGEQRLEQFTDDCGIFLACNPDANIRIIKGSEENIKITYPIDLILADEMFRLRSNLSEGDKPGLNLRGKNIVVFGGTRGIGKALTDVLLTGGAQVLVFSRQTGCDISIENNVECALQTAINEFGSIDAVVNTAGILKTGNLNEQSGSEILEQINTNLNGALNIARYSYKWLKESKGSLLFFSSSSYTRGRSGSVVYSATKSAIVNLTQGLSEEWASEGIKVNCIIPSRTDTDMRQKNFKEESQDSLSNPYKVAIAGAKTISQSLFGQIIRVQ